MNQERYPTEDEQRILEYVGTNPLVTTDQVVEKLNMSPDYFDELMERMAFVGLMIPNKESNLNREHFKKMTLEDYHIFRTILVFKKLEKKGVLSFDCDVIYGAKSFVFELAENGITAPIETETGIFIFKLISKKPADVAPLQEAEKSIRKILSRIKFNKQIKKWIEGLKKEAYVEIKQ